MSPGPADWAGTRSSASVMKSSVTLACFDRAVDATPRHALTALEIAIDDATQRETPRYGDASRLHTSA